MPIFRSPVQAEVLSRLFLGDDELSVAELARVVNTPVPTVHREVARLEDAGLIVARPLGRTRLWRANREHPAFEPLSALLNVAFGPPLVIAEEFASIAAEEVGIFGSWAARYRGGSGRFPGDIDVMVVGDYSVRPEVYAGADAAQRRLGIKVNTVLRSPEEWAAASPDPLVADIRSTAYLTVLRGGEPEVDQLSFFS